QGMWIRFGGHEDIAVAAVEAHRCLKGNVGETLSQVYKSVIIKPFEIAYEGVVGFLVGSLVEAYPKICSLSNIFPKQVVVGIYSSGKNLHVVVCTASDAGRSMDGKPTVRN